MYSQFRVKNVYLTIFYRRYVTVLPIQLLQRQGSFDLPTLLRLRHHPTRSNYDAYKVRNWVRYMLLVRRQFLPAQIFYQLRRMSTVTIPVLNENELQNGQMFVFLVILFPFFRPKFVCVGLLGFTDTCI